MDVKIDPRWADVISEALDSGRYGSQEEVVAEGLRLFADRERRLQELRESLAEAVKEGGDFSSEDVMQGVRQRLAEIAARRRAAE